MRKKSEENIQKKSPVSLHKFKFFDLFVSSSQIFSEMEVFSCKFVILCLSCRKISIQTSNFFLQGVVILGKVLNLFSLVINGIVGISELSGEVLFLLSQL